MKHLEDDLQESIITYFRYAHKRYVIFAIPNGGKRNIREAVRLKRQGVLAGASDLVVIIKGKVLFIELKCGKNQQSASQKQFESDVKSLEHDYYLCRSLEQFQEIMSLYL